MPHILVRKFCKSENVHLKLHCTKFKESSLRSVVFITWIGFEIMIHTKSSLLTPVAK